MKKSFRNLFLLFLISLFLLSTACSSKENKVLYLSGYSTIYRINTRDNSLSWSREVNCLHSAAAADSTTDTLWVGTENENIHAWATSGTSKYGTAASFNNDIQAEMLLVDGILYYNGAYDSATSMFPLYARDVENNTETALPVGICPAGNFTVYENCLYACSATGITVYDLKTGEAVAYELEDPEYTYISLSENILTAGYADRLEWYSADMNSLEKINTISAADLGLENFSVIGTGTAAAVLIEHGASETAGETAMYVYLLETESLVLCDLLSESPGFITFSDDGFYALWKHQLIYYDYDGNQKVICEDTGTYYTELEESDNT